MKNILRKTDFCTRYKCFHSLSLRLLEIIIQTTSLQKLHSGVTTDSHIAFVTEKSTYNLGFFSYIWFLVFNCTFSNTETTFVSTSLYLFDILLLLLKGFPHQAALKLTFSSCQVNTGTDIWLDFTRFIHDLLSLFVSEPHFPQAPTLSPVAFLHLF